MENYKNISNNSLEEMNCLVGRLKQLISRDFCHVEELGNLPKILKLINEEGDRIDKEFDRRDDLEYNTK